MKEFAPPSKQQGLTGLYQLVYMNTGLIQKHLEKSAIQLWKKTCCLYPEIQLRMEILTGVHSLEISHPDDPYGQQVAGRGFYLENGTKQSMNKPSVGKSIKCAN